MTVAACGVEDDPTGVAAGLKRVFHSFEIYEDTTHRFPFSRE